MSEIVVSFLNEKKMYLNIWIKLIVFIYVRIKTQNDMSKRTNKTEDNTNI